jgi:hypothetical protein
MGLWHFTPFLNTFLRNNPSAVMFFQRFIFPAYNITFQGRIQDFKLAGTHLKKLRRAEEGAEI